MYRRQKIYGSQICCKQMTLFSLRVQPMIYSYYWIDFMDNLGLKINYTKSCTMILGPKNFKTKTYIIKDHRIGNVEKFCYLGILLDPKLNWDPLLRSHVQSFNRIAHSIYAFSRWLGYSHIKSFLYLDKAKCVPTVAFRVEIWGYKWSLSIQVAENKFLRRILRIPQSVPAEIVHDELGAGFIADYM